MQNAKLELKFNKKGQIQLDTLQEMQIASAIFAHRVRHLCELVNSKNKSFAILRGEDFTHLFNGIYEQVDANTSIVNDLIEGLEKL